MSAICGIDAEKLKSDLHDRIFYNPMQKSYQLSDIFIAGNVVEKAESIERHIELYPDSPNIEECRLSLKALQNATPEQVDFEAIDFNFGERWINTKIYEDYASQIFETKIIVKYHPGFDGFSVESRKKQLNLIITQKYAVKGESQTYNGLYLLQHALVNTVPYITKTVMLNGEEVRAPDNDAIQVATNIIEQIRDGFSEWLDRQSPKFKKELETAYNRKFNSSVKPRYDGSFQTFPGLRLEELNIKELYASQKDCIWMLKCAQGGIADHEVGSGKTLIMCIAAREMKRIGLIRKPLILGLKANVHDIADTFSKSYPDAKMLYPGANDFTPENRKRIFNQIKNSDWDVVILTHDQFFKIPQALEVQQEILQAELDALVADLVAMEKMTGVSASKRMISGLEIRQKNLAAKLRDIRYKIEKQRDDTVDFLTMGFDHIFLDESQMFKNLTYTTRYGRVAGLGNSEGSKRALNMLFAIRTIQNMKNRDLCATFLSGTTVSNSLVELYLIFKYLRPRALAAQAINSFDGWAAVFAKKTADYEFSVTNEIIRKERFRHFIKVPELCNFYHEITDFRTADDVGLDRPALNPVLLSTPPTPEQAEFTKKLIEFTRTGDGNLIGRGKLSDSERQAIMLIATTYARKMSLDMRLISPYYFDSPHNKLSRCAAKIAEYYYRYNAYRGTQFFFSDLGTYKRGNGNFNIYTELKRKLVEEHHIPAIEIKFIQECNNTQERKELFAAMNGGTVRVLMGSTSMLGTGVNAQRRAVAIHHFDIPWKPSEMEQRNGRVSRPGNIVAKEYADNKVDCFIYATERTLDTYKFNILQNKQTFINQMKRNSLNLRTIDEGASDDGAMNFAEYVAVMSGNNDLLERAKLEKAIMGLENERRAFTKNRSVTEYRLNAINKSIASERNRLADYMDDWEYINDVAPANGKGKRHNPIIIDGLKPSSISDIGYRLLEIEKFTNTNGLTKKIGALYRFDIAICTRKDTKGNSYNAFYTIGKNLNLYSHNHGILASKPETAVNYFISALEHLPRLIEQTKNSIENREKDIPVLEKILENTWNNASKLQKLKTELDTLDRKISISLESINDQINGNDE